MRILRNIALAAMLASPAAFAACRSSNAYDVENRKPEDTMLVVENQNFYDVDIYALSSGLPTRIGTVSGSSGTGRFALNATIISSTDFRLVAAPIGGNGRASSGPLLVGPGQTIKFTITPSLSHSHAEVQ
ncbi:MAG: hypothetical protein ABI664_12485 [bacterium]